MPIKIAELQIRDFRGIEHLDLSFRDPKGEPTSLVVLAGPNGCGKTAVLEAVLLAAGYRNQIRGKAGPSAVRTGAEDFLVQAKFQDSTYGFQHVECRKATNPGTIGKMAYFASWREPKLVGPLGITAGKRGKRPAATSVNRLWRLKQYLIDTLALELFKKQHGQPSLHPSLSDYQYALSRLHQVWQRFYPGDVLLVEPVDQSPEGGFDVFICRPDHTRVSVDDLSSGQLELLQFCADFLVSREQLDVLVIDEPELHLDPAWHTQIIRAIQDLAPQTQLIVATHSPEIYDAAMSFERHFLVPDDDPRSAFWARSNAACETSP